MAMRRLRAPIPSATDRSRGWGSVLAVAGARAVLSLVASLVLWSLLPCLAGGTPRLILSGSMEPRIHVGDVIVTRPYDAARLTKGQVVTVRDPDHSGRTRTHRFVGRDDTGDLILKGDANREADSSHVVPSTLLGLAMVRVPYVGRPAYWMAAHDWIPVGATGLVLGWCVLLAFPGRRDDADPGDDGPAPSGGGAAGGEQESRRRLSLTHRVVVTVLAGGLGIGAGAGPAEAAFAKSVLNATSTLSAASNFYPYQTAVLADSPSFYWRLAQTSGTTVSDTSTNLRPATLSGSTYAWGATGALASETRDTALSLTSAWATANTPVAGPTTFSLEAWIKTSSGTGGRIIGWGDKGGSTASTSTLVDRQLYLAPTGKAYFGIGGTKTVIPSLAPLNDNTWHHVVGTYTTGLNGMKLYVDGALQGRATATTISTLAGYWRAGGETMTGWTGNPDTYYDGLLDEVAVYPTALTATRVSAHYSAGITP